MANEVMKEDSRESFEDTPKGWQRRWTKEMSAADKMTEKFWKQGDDVLKRYLDNRDGEMSIYSARLNLFHSGINTIKSMLYGQVPKVDFDRRYADPDDDVARVATLIYERILNADIERPDDDYTAVLRECLCDRLLPGMGVGRVRYEAVFKETTVPAMYSEDGVELAPEYLENTLQLEQAKIDYTHWKDFLWSHARTWHEVRWVAFRSWLSYDELVERFGKEKAKKVNLVSQYSDKHSKDEKEAWQKGEIWEIWNKENKCVHWWSKGMDEQLDYKEDFLKLKNFFPCPKPMMANTTSTLLIPKSDFVIDQDIYNEIDNLNARISKLTEAVRVIGVYDKSNPELQRILKEACENEMIRVENWGAFVEKQGLKGVVDWFPLETVVNTLDKLRELRSEQIALLYQVTGLSDIMRGQSEGSDRVSATEQSIKAKFASVRMQALQDEFARFGTDLIRLKGEIISKHFQPQTIIEESNIMKTPDAQLAGQAVQLLQNDEQFVWRIWVRPESMAMVDYQALQQERGGFLTAVATFMQSAAPMLEKMPGSLPTMLELLKWGLAGFKGSQQIEGVMDRAVKAALDAAKNPPPPKPDPEMIKVQGQLKLMEADVAATKEKSAAAMQEAQQKAAIDAETARQEMQQDNLKFLQEMRQDNLKFLQEMAQGRQEMALAKEQGEQKIDLAEKAAAAKPNGNE